jgi:hypothetical protein
VLFFTNDNIILRFMGPCAGLTAVDTSALRAVNRHRVSVAVPPPEGGCTAVTAKLFPRLLTHDDPGSLFDRFDR